MIGNAMAPFVRGGGGMGGQSQPPLSSVPLPQLSQIIQQSDNPALKAAAISEIGRRAGSSFNDMASSGPMPAMQGPQPQLAMPQSPLQAVAAGVPYEGGGSPAARVASIPPNMPTLSAMPAPPQNPALSSISAGTAAAQDVANQTPASIDQGVGYDNQSAAGQPSPALTSVGDLLKGLSTSVTPQQRDLALAKGFFTMAASRQPGFFGALGEGGNAATDALQAAQDQATKNKMFGIDVTQRQQGYEETARSDKVREAQGEQSLKLAQGQLDQAQKRFEFEQQQWRAGFGTEQALKAAQIALAQAQTNYSQVESQVAQSNAGQIVQTDQGLQRISGGTATPIMGQNGQPLNQSYVGRANATQTKYDLLTQAGIDPQQAALMVAGKQAMTPAQMINAASLAASRAVANSGVYDPQQQKGIYDSTYSSAMATLQAGAPAATGTTAGTGGAPAAGGPPPGAQTATNPQTKQRVYLDPNTNQWVPY